MTIETLINQAWEDRLSLSPYTTGQTVDAVQKTLNDLDAGRLRVAEKQG